MHVLSLTRQGGSLKGSTPEVTACQITSSLKEISTAAASSHLWGCLRCRLPAIPHFQHRAHLSSQFLDLGDRLRFPLARLDLQFLDC